MTNHVSKVASICFSSAFHLRCLRQVRHLVGREVTVQLVPALVLLRLDYCNYVLSSLPRCTSTTEQLQRVLNAAARLVVGFGPF